MPGAEQRKYSNMPIDMAKRALKLASRGLSVLPMHSAHRGRCTCAKGNACERAGKHPTTRHGVNDATTDGEQIDRWWTEQPDANIGIAAGQSLSILVLDIDPRNGGTETLQRLEKELGPLPPTVTSNTGGGGEHRIFKYPNFSVRKDFAGKLLGPGVDVLSDGCIMIAPPSRHASGKRYRWEEGRSFRHLEPAPLPEPWLDRLRGNTAAKPDARQCAATRGTCYRRSPEQPSDEFRWNAAAQRRVARGYRRRGDGGKCGHALRRSTLPKSRKLSRAFPNIRLLGLAMVPTPPKV